MANSLPGIKSAPARALPVMGLDPGFHDRYRACRTTTNRDRRVVKANLVAGRAERLMTPEPPKREKRRIELADYAIHCFAEHGYAETSLRDIAAAAGINLGRLHYYFESKTDLVTFAIRRYKASYIADLISTYQVTKSSQRGITAMIRSIASNLLRDAKIHRFWYDLRTQAMFDEELRLVSLEIEHELEKATFDLLRKVDGAMTAQEAHTYHLLMDAMFFDTLRKSLGGDARAVTRFRRSLADLFVRIAKAPGKKMGLSS